MGLNPISYLNPIRYFFAPPDKNPGSTSVVMLHDKPRSQCLIFGILLPHSQYDLVFNLSLSFSQTGILHAEGLQDVPTIGQLGQH